MTVITSTERMSPETIEAARQCASNIIHIIESDYQLRAPRSERERNNHFAIWLEKYREQYRSLMDATLAPLLKVNQIVCDENLADRLINEEVWPRVAQRLREHAILFCASKWASHNLGDATVMHQPVFDGNYWRIDIGVKNYNDRVGQIVLDQDGGVVLDLTTSHQEIDDSLHDYILPPAEAANR